MTQAEDQPADSTCAAPSRKRLARLCLGARHHGAALAAGRSTLPPETAQALADLLPILLCGEESAEFVFTDAVAALPLAQAPGFRAQLQRIAEDERYHGRLLDQLRQSLPPPSRRGTARMAAHFLRRLASAELAVHLTRIAALDAGLCQILAAVGRADGPVARSPDVAASFQRIRRDEGRHIRTSRRCAAALGLDPATEAHERRCVLRSFAALLAPHAAAFAALGVNFSTLLARLERLGGSSDSPALGVIAA